MNNYVDGGSYDRSLDHSTYTSSYAQRSLLSALHQWAKESSVSRSSSTTPSEKSHGEAFESSDAAFADQDLGDGFRFGDFEMDFRFRGTLF